MTCCGCYLGRRIKDGGFDFERYYGMDVESFRKLATENPEKVLEILQSRKLSLAEEIEIREQLS